MNHSTAQEKPFTRVHAGVLALSAAAAATATWVEFQSRRAERDNPPQGKYIHIDGVRLHYLARGAGPPLVLLHGNSVTVADYEASGLIDRLAAGHSVIAFDRPGFGHSSRPRQRLWTPAAQAALLRKALAGLGIDRAVVLGHSMGALVALALALDAPASVSGLVLIGGYYYPQARLDVALAWPVALPVVGDVMRYTSTALTARMTMNRMAKAMFAPDPVPPGFFTAQPREMMLRPLQLRADAEDAAFMIPQAASLAKRYHELHMPVTLVAGADDRIVAVEKHTQRLHAEIPHSELLLVRGAGHMAHYRAQEQIVSAIGSQQQSLPRPAQPVGSAGAASVRPAPFTAR